MSEIHYHAGYNMVGYLPETDVYQFETFAGAQSYMIDTLDRWADSSESWVDEHDCDDPCPTYGDSCGWNEAQNLRAEAEDLASDNGPDWGTIVGNESFWIVSCVDDCEDDES